MPDASWDLVFMFHVFVSTLCQCAGIMVLLLFCAIEDQSYVVCQGVAVCYLIFYLHKHAHNAYVRATWLLCNDFELCPMTGQYH